MPFISSNVLFIAAHQDSFCACLSGCICAALQAIKREILGEDEEDEEEDGDNGDEEDDSDEDEQPAQVIILLCSTSLHWGAACTQSLSCFRTSSCWDYFRLSRGVYACFYIRQGSRV